MALRILLADESATIKKVIELSLQDYAVDLRIVNLGVDVLEVAKSFNPDLVLVDILLQKKNGYEVCHELKANEETKDIPVVILWSGFMELDQAKLQVVGADDTLEKPFDSEKLRELVTKYVPSAGQDNPLMQHLQVPDIPAPRDFTQVKTMDEINSELDQVEPENQAPEIPVAPANPPEVESGEWNMDSFDGLPDFDFPDEEAESEDETDIDEDDFSHFEIKTTSPTDEVKPDTLIEMPDDESESNDWVNQSLGKFQLDLPEAEDDLEELNNLEIGEVGEPIEDTSFLWNSEAEASEATSPTKIEEIPPAVETPEAINFDEPSMDYPEDMAPIAPPSILKEVPSLNFDTKEEAPASPIGSKPTEEEIASAPEISIGESHTDSGFEIEHNHEIGIETIEAPSTVNTAALKGTQNSSNEAAIHDFLNSPNFQSMIKDMVEQKLGEAIERLVPEMAKETIEKEIQRLLDEPFQE